MGIESKSGESSASLFERLGGTGAITTVVDMFYYRVVSDPALSRFFGNIHTDRLDRLKKRQVEFFTQALGGPAIYKGRDMKSAHERFPIEPQHFDIVAKHLIETLQSAGVSQKLIDEVVGAVAPLAKDIVNTTQTLTTTANRQSFVNSAE